MLISAVNTGPTRGVRWVLLMTLSVLAGAFGACTTGSPDPTEAFRPTATIQDIMLSMVDPSADGIWEAVATIITYEGVEERRPRTDEDWEHLRHEAVRLVEATNLLLMEGREVAAAGVRSENPGIELHPEEIQALIAADRETWDRLVGDLYDKSLIMLQAVDAKDPDMMFDNGGPLDQACERCHQRYWYPDDAGARPTAAAPAPGPGVASTPSGPTGTIQGHVQLTGQLPGNAVIRMGVDPRCAQLNADTQVVQETVRAARDGSLAHVFVRLEGTFPEVPIPAEPVVIDQRDCVFVPRVVGARVGQLVQIKNSDPVLHNVHSLSATTNSFNVGQPMEGMVFDARLGEEEGMLRIKCDVHRWMTEYIGVVPHPYFAVSDLSGAFTIRDVPSGTHTIQAWHEVYGELTQAVRVETGATTAIDFRYAGETS